jgi:nucleoside-diphosphate-sugar epimerase
MAETILITGGSGFIGLQLTRELAKEGNRIVVFDLMAPEPIAGVEEGRIVHVRGDVTSLPQVLNAVRDSETDSIIHLAALLSEPSEANPWASININGMGTYHILEAARLFRVKKVIFTSSMAVYVNSRYRVEVADEKTVQKPQIIYGVLKAFGENLGLYYHGKFGVDFRGVRFPNLIGPNVATPGFGQYNSKIIECAMLGMPFEVNVPEDTVIPLLYIKDAIKSLIQLYHAREERLLTRVYNVGQIMPPPRTIDIVAVVKKYFPDAQITFKPDPRSAAIVGSTPREIKGDRAQEEWDWSASYSLDEAVKDFIETRSPV